MKWFKIGGAFVQGEVHIKKNNEIQLHGRAIVVFSNFFIVAGTFNHNRLERDFCYMLDLLKPDDKTTFERTFNTHFKLLVRKSKTFNSYLLDTDSLFKLTALNAYTVDNPDAYQQVLNHAKDTFFDKPDQTRLPV